MLKAYVAAKRRVMDFRERLSEDESGAALVEYALLVGLVAVAGITALTGLQGKLSSAFGVIGGKLATIQ